MHSQMQRRSKNAWKTPEGSSRKSWTYPITFPRIFSIKPNVWWYSPPWLSLPSASGGSYGRGVMTCRTGEDFHGPWGPPSIIALEGGSVGFQLGGQATDFVLLLMSSRSGEAVLSSKVKLGADAAAAAGPKGRDAAAATDVTLRAAIMTYSRSRGLFAGISLEGSTLRPDKDGNKDLYGKDVTPKDIVLKGAVPAPPSAQELLSTLNNKTPKAKAAN